MIIYSLPFFAAFLGWFTNFLAVKMLFHPRKPVNLFFFELQGVFPKRQGAIAEKLGKMVVEELFSTKDLKEKINTPENMDHIYDTIELKIEEYLTNTFPGKFPIISMVLSEKMKNNIKDELMTEIERITPNVIDNYFNQLESKLDIEEIVRTKVAALSSEKLEGLINSIISKEFRFIEIVGAIIGFMIGCVQILLMQFA